MGNSEAERSGDMMGPFVPSSPSSNIASPAFPTLLYFSSSTLLLFSLLPSSSSPSPFLASSTPHPSCPSLRPPSPLLLCSSAPLLFHSPLPLPSHHLLMFSLPRSSPALFLASSPPRPATPPPLSLLIPSLPLSSFFPSWVPYFHPPRFLFITLQILPMPLH